MLKTIVTQPSIEPVTLDEAKAHLVVEHAEDDVLIERIIASARFHLEERCNRAIVRQKWRLFLDYSFSSFKLEPATVQEVESINYTDSDGASQILSPSVYTVDIPRQCVYLAYGQTWPATRNVTNAVWADVWSGYYDSSVSPIDLRIRVPESLRHALLILTAEMYERREPAVVGTIYTKTGVVESLIQPHIVYA